MDELQITFIEGKLFLWGVSSHTDKVFTPIDRLKKAYSKLFISEKIITETNNIEIPAIGDAPVVPPSMRLFFNQFDVKNALPKTFSIEGIKICDEALLYNYLNQEKKGGFLFGDAYELFRTYLKFAFSLVSRQRFVPYFKDEQSYFLPNLDNADDFESFQDFCNKAPLSIKQKIAYKIEDILNQCLGYLINRIIEESISDSSLSLKNETKTDKWVFGLFGKKVRVDKEIMEGLNQWLVSRKVNRDLEYNLLFKLEEPSENQNNWRLVYNIQSKMDLSLIIKISDVWGNKKVPIKNVKIHLLQDLGIAAKVSRIIERSLYKPTPSEIVLSNDEAMEFIARDSFLLKDIGFVVQIPKITFAKLNSLKVRVQFKDTSKFKISGIGYLGKALFDFNYKVAMGGIELSKEEFYELSKCKEKIVKLQGKWVEVNEKDVKKVIEFFEKRSKLSISDTIIANTSENTGFEIEEVTVPEQFREEINGMFNFREISKIDTPKNFVGCLRPYQKEGFSWMLFLQNLGFGGILADDMGLGKTIQTIAYFLFSAEKPSLVIGPTSVIGNWQRELHKFSPNLKIHLHHGSGRLNKNQFLKEIQKKDLVISSYATARRDEDILSSVEWSTIILDEAQNIKNPYTKQTVAMHKLKSKNRFCLTGTPIENRLSELWSIMNFCNPGFLSSWDSFKKNFAEPIELQNDSYKTSLLKKIIAPFVLRRLKTDKQIIMDLPKKIEIKEYCTLTKEQATLYQAVVDDSMQKIESETEKRRALIMATLIKLKQICNHPTNYLKDTSKKLLDRSGKVTRLRELIDIFLRNDEKCLIFTQYKEMGDLLKPDLEDYFDAPVCYLHGQQNRKEREQMIDYFQSDDKASPMIFILSLKAGGLGINLTKASQVIHFDRWWNPAVENQATDRAYRIGQTKKVFVYKFITSGTVEEKIDEMIERKLVLSDSLLSKGEISITELDNKKLKELFSLRRECLED